MVGPERANAVMNRPRVGAEEKERGKVVVVRVRGETDLDLRKGHHRMTMGLLYPVGIRRGLLYPARHG